MASVRTAFVHCRVVDEANRRASTRRPAGSPCRISTVPTSRNCWLLSTAARGIRASHSITCRCGPCRTRRVAWRTRSRLPGEAAASACLAARTRQAVLREPAPGTDVDVALLSSAGRSPRASAGTRRDGCNLKPLTFLRRRQQGVVRRGAARRRRVFVTRDGLHRDGCIEWSSAQRVRKSPNSLEGRDPGCRTGCCVASSRHLRENPRSRAAVACPGCGGCKLQPEWPAASHVVQASTQVGMNPARRDAWSTSWIAREIEVRSAT